MHRYRYLAKLLSHRNEGIAKGDPAFRRWRVRGHDGSLLRLMQLMPRGRVCFGRVLQGSVRAGQATVHRKVVGVGRRGSTERLFGAIQGRNDLAHAETRPGDRGRVARGATLDPK